MDSERPSKDLCYLLRRPHAGIIDRDSGAFGRRCDLSALCAPRPVGIQGDHDASTADGVQWTDSRIRWRMSLLSPPI